MHCNTNARTWEEHAHKKTPTESTMKIDFRKKDNVVVAKTRQHRARHCAIVSILYAQKTVVSGNYARAHVLSRCRTEEG